MIRKEITEGLVRYFKSDQWQKFMRMLTQTDDEMSHIHVYTENRVHPESLAKLLPAYHKLKGVDLDRGILFGGSPGMGALLNVQPTDPKTGRFLANYELFWFYNPNVVLAGAEIRPDMDLSGHPMYREVREGNLYGWGKKYMDDYYKQFDFKYVGPNEEREIRRYFQSDHFKKWLRVIEETAPHNHVHCNVEINFHPWILKMYACEALKELGLKIDWVVPNVFVVARAPSGYMGKLIFLCAHPEWQHDICWEYNPDVVIRPATKPFVGVRSAPDGDFSFDLNLRQDFEDMLAAGEYVTVTDEEIDEVMSRV